MSAQWEYDLQMSPDSPIYQSKDEPEEEKQEDIITCPHCGYKMPESEYEQVCDEGCPSCRRVFELSEFDLFECMADLVRPKITIEIL